jgi:hypothetical protein
MDGIRDWLVACGETFGCREVHHYRWPDPDTRPEVPYLTYRATRVVPSRPGVRGARTSGVAGEDAHTVLSESHRQFLVDVRVDLFNSEFGLGWLAKCAVACEKEQAIKTIFQRNNIGFHDLLNIEDRTTEDAAEIDYHQRMTIQFYTTVTHTHKNLNHKIDSVDITAAIDTE